MRRIFAIVLIVLGLSTIGAAIASGTIWRPDDRVTLALPATPDVPLVITAPGVLNAVANDVDVRVVGASADSPIVLAMARESDVRAWIGDAPHWEITGLADWETLAYTDSRDTAGSDPTETATGETDAPTDATATPTATETPATTDAPTDGTETPADEAEPTETIPNPTGADLWVEELTGTGELAYSWTAVPGRWVMLVATDGTEPAPQVELTWDREVETPFVQPGIILGGVVFLLGLGLLIFQVLVDLEKRGARRAAALEGPAAPAGTVEPAPAVVTTDGDRPLTRREIRLAEEARRRGSVPAKSGVPGDSETETIPAVPAEDGSTAAPEARESTEPTGQTQAAPGAPDDDAGELDAWVRSGSASPLLHEGDRTTPSGLEVPADQATEERGAVLPQDVVPSSTASPGSSESPESPARESWWRRRSGQRSDEAVTAHEPAADRTTDQADQADQAESAEQPGAQAVEQPLPVEPAVSREVPANGETDEIPAVQPGDEGDPQEWGASWRQTWGVGADSSEGAGRAETTDPGTEPKEDDR